MTGTGTSRRSWALLAAAPLLAAALTSAAHAQRVDRNKGVDPRVDYESFKRLGPWDDRNYLVQRADLALLAANEHELRDPIPVFFRIELRRTVPGLPRTGVPQYPRSALQIFEMRYGGYLVDGQLYRGLAVRNGRFEVIREHGTPQEEFERTKALTSDVRVTSPTGAAESAVKIHPTDLNRVVAGSNGPGSGQIMWYSTNGGAAWTQAAALPQGSTCCDPTIDWSSNGAYAYTSALGGCGADLCNIYVYRSADGGATWNDLANVTPGDGRRELTSAGISDKEYIHVDKFATSPNRDNVYLCWHDHNTLQFSRSTDFANTWSANLSMSSGTSQSGIGCDLATDKSGNVYYFWPATNGQTILVRKSTNGGSSFATAVTVSATTDGYDFAIPAMETRRAFIYASADADLSSGTYANSVYVAWTDTTAAEDPNVPANNHARIRVAYTRDGGATWTVRTPHETADASTVDRFHPWLGVADDGKVYVMFYDTRRSASRVGVDVFYAVSSDGGNTWTTPARITSVMSPQIDDGFEWGDYNGLDVVGSQLISIFTDNRNEGGGSADSIDVYASGLTIGGGPGNTPPVVTITAPTSGTSVTQGTSVAFSGTANDTEDGNLSSSLTWSSSIGGNIGSGASFSTSSLAVGTHTITASVTDTGGAPGSAQITLTVTSTGNVLTKGVPVSGISGATGSQQFWTMTVPAGATNLTFNTTGGSDTDVDLYVRFGSPPTTTVRDCASETATNNESCSFPAPSAGTYHVLLYGYSAYSGVTLTGNYTTPCTPPAVPTGVVASAASASQVNVSWAAASGATSYTVSRSTTSGGPYSSVGTSTTTSFSNTGLTCNTTYYYVVSASNGTCSSANSTQASATTSACTGSTTVTFYSTASLDGRIWENGETGNAGGGGNSTDNLTTALRIGDTSADEQYKSIVSFDTSSIPDGATITAATLRLVRGTLSGTSPFTTHGPCVADIMTGGFGGSTAFAYSDWQAAATANAVATMSSPTADGSASTGTLSSTGRSAVNKTGTTQLRVYCTLDDNDDLGFDYIGFYPGETSTTANRPQLTVTYQ
jgi:hypothetical protein